MAGHVAMPPGTALAPEALAARIFLPCVAEARSDCVVEVGERLGLLEVPIWTGS